MIITTPAMDGGRAKDDCLGDDFLFFFRNPLLVCTINVKLIQWDTHLAPQFKGTTKPVSSALFNFHVDILAAHFNNPQINIYRDLRKDPLRRSGSAR